ncbi:MAG: nitrogenase-stabilizing/protective protein NifW [Cyanobacteria bacterium P01_G01_bin.49]
MTITADTPKTLTGFKKLTDTEDYLEFFGISYDPTFVNVNRLHILKQFSLLISEVDKTFPDLSESEKLAKYKLAFEEAYELFKTASPLETKLFKVFKDTPSNVVLLEDLAKEAETK